MVVGAPNKKLDKSPRIISIQVGDKFYEELQRQIEEATQSMTLEQAISLFLLLLGISLVVELAPDVVRKAAQEILENKSSFAWSYLSELQKDLPEGKTLGELLRETNIQLAVNDKPIALPHLVDSAANEFDEPFENFKRGWDDAMNGRTMSFEEFERRMLEDAD